MVIYIYWLKSLKNIFINKVGHKKCRHFFLVVHSIRTQDFKTIQTNAEGWIEFKENFLWIPIWAAHVWLSFWLRSCLTCTKNSYIQMIKSMVEYMWLCIGVLFQETTFPPAIVQFVLEFNKISMPKFKKIRGSII